MRANNLENIPFPNAKKLKNKRKGPDTKSAAFANNRRNARQQPTRQFNRGR
ncbi:hypothetical protein [Actinomadura algeriensis]|uniref:Uncharacterized protein n=1 Tax=Actinomadura algeriensis TaxID=1679523 RepID=A0ABR9JQY1_9ACTN|nr:hypothetical protein [Actinomadura algeriensis]MBE1532788.1 hypothetical protein [Actinomadura algeriensis]